MEIEALLKVALRGGANEIFLKQGMIPRFRYNNEVIPLSDGREIPSEFFKAWLERLIPSHVTRRLETQGDAHFSWTSKLGVRFRVLVHRQRQTFSIILRTIPPQIPTLKDLNMPQQITDLCSGGGGLVVIAGAARSGKSTVTASLLATINSARACHILTIEDPIEFIHSDARSFVEQREIGIDTPSFEKGLRATMLHRPDVLALSDLRDKESLDLSLQIAQGGTLVLLPMTAIGCADALERLLHQWRSPLTGTTSHYLASSLRSIVALTQVPRIDGRGSVTAVEVLTNTPRLQGWLLGRTESDSGWAFVKTLLTDRSETSNISLDQSLAQLCQDGIISRADAASRSENQEDFQRSLRRLG